MCGTHVSLWLKHLWGLELGAMHLACTAAVIERCRRTLTALWAPFFSLSSSQSPRESSSLPFIWFSWAGSPCLVYPIVIPSSLSSQLRKAPRRGPLDPAPLRAQQEIPGVSTLSLIISRFSLRLPLHQLSDGPPTRTHAFTHTQNWYTKTQTFSDFRAHKNHKNDSSSGQTWMVCSVFPRLPLWFSAGCRIHCWQPVSFQSVSLLTRWIKWFTQKRKQKCAKYFECYKEIFCVLEFYMHAPIRD